MLTTLPVFASFLLGESPPQAVSSCELDLSFSPARLFAALPFESESTAPGTGNELEDPNRIRHVCFFDSVSSEPGSGQHSYLMFDPMFWVEVRPGTAILSQGKSSWQIEETDPFEILMQTEKWAATNKNKLKADFPDDRFYGGTVLLFGYECKNFVESLPQTNMNEDYLPLAIVAFYPKVLAYDHQTTRWESRSIMGEPLQKDDLPIEPGELRTFAVGELESSMNRRKWEKNVVEIKELIGKGEVYQVDLTRKIEGTFEGSAKKLYMKLRETNPAPYGGFLDLGANRFLLSSSPERLLRISHDRCLTWPIKGTVPRSDDDSEDEKFKQQLLSSEKDRAELSMIVDLLRNDLNRVCKPDSVEVVEHARLRSYSTVHHLVSEIAGSIDDNDLRTEVLRALFPGGSITGAPKIRSMELIDRFEPSRRGAYTGSWGWLSPSGDADWNILIRSIQIADSHIRIDVGGGIVYDSDPREEWNETVSKAKGMMNAIENEDKRDD